MSAHSRPDLPAGTIVSNRYVVERVLGQGAMALVYRVRHVQLNTLHAMKLLMIPSFTVQQRLIQEGRVQASLRHVNVVSVTDVVDFEGAPGLIMEYIQGPSLEELLGGTKITAAQSEALAVVIISGVAAAHDHGLIHRDLKPANVMLSVQSQALVPKVADFGLAKILSNDSASDMTATQSGIAMGTPAYMAPEQFRDAKSVDARADVFSLGAILYELACGERAFRGDNFLDVYQAVADGDYLPPRDLVPDLPERMTSAICGALTNDRDERIPDCRTLLAIWTGKAELDAVDRNGTMAAGPWDASMMERVSSLGSGEDLTANTQQAVADAISSGDRSRDTWFPDSKATTASLSDSIESSQARAGSLSDDGHSGPKTGKNTRILWIGGFGVSVAAAAVLALVVGPLVGIGNQPQLPIETNTDLAAPPSPTATPTSEPTSNATTATPPDSETPDEAAPTDAADSSTPAVATTAEPTPTSASSTSTRRRRTASRSSEKPSSETSTSTAPDPKPSGQDEPTPTDEPIETTDAPPSTPEPVAKKPSGPPAGMARITIKGDAKRVWLVNSKGNHAPGDLGPGTYTIKVMFPGMEPRALGQVTLKEGEQRVMNCQSMFQRCQ